MGQLIIGSDIDHCSDYQNHFFVFFISDGWESQSAKSGLCSSQQSPCWTHEIMTWEKTRYGSGPNFIFGLHTEGGFLLCVSNQMHVNCHKQTLNLFLYNIIPVVQAT